MRRAPEAPRARHGWLRDVAEEVSLRPAEACEREAARSETESERDAAEGIARTLEVDLEGDGSAERVVLAIRRELVVALTDGRCNPLWRNGFRPEQATLVGPSPGPDPWASVPAAEVQRLFATDALPRGGSHQVFVVRGEGAHRHVLVVERGSLGALRYGWRALVLGCHAGRCTGTHLGHVERAALPTTLGCGPTFRAYHAPPEVEIPLLHVTPGSAPGELVLTPHARHRDTCGDAPEETRALAPFRVGP